MTHESPGEAGAQAPTSEVVETGRADDQGRGKRAVDVTVRDVGVGQRPADLGQLLQRSVVGHLGGLIGPTLCLLVVSLDGIHVTPFQLITDVRQV